MAKILMVGSEAAPFAKTGGLGDVLGALPRALKALGEDVAVVLPRYRSAKGHSARQIYEEFPIHLGLSRYPASVFQADYDGVPYFLIECPSLFDRDGIYGDRNSDYPDNHIRFAALSMATVGIMRHLFRPQILHAHDWQAGLAPCYLRTQFWNDPTFVGVRTLLTIHNVAYQGIYPPALLQPIALDPSLFQPNGVEFYGNISLLKAGIQFSDWVSTVSETHAREIQTSEYGFGMEGLLAARRDRLAGILNGVDYSQWCPENDTLIAARYSRTDLSGKRTCKLDLLAELGMPENLAGTPVIGIVSRLAWQKGFDLLEPVAADLMRENVALAVLGSGDTRIEEFFRSLAQSYPGRVGLKIGYDNSLAHKIEAGADMFLMPSRYEPCGLNQIFSLRYGTVPVVRATGGLQDTIDETVGFRFSDISGPAMLDAIRNALSVHARPDDWKFMMLKGMERDYSWEHAAAKYSQLYSRILG